MSHHYSGPDFGFPLGNAPGSEPYFDRDLAMLADVFEVWRYIHEQHPIDTDLGFMQRLARAVEKALAAMT
jgi:hypothetical protein